MAAEKMSHTFKVKHDQLYANACLCDRWGMQSPILIMDFHLLHWLTVQSADVFFIIIIIIITKIEHLSLRGMNANTTLYPHGHSLTHTHTHTHILG